MTVSSPSGTAATESPSKPAYQALLSLPILPSSYDPLPGIFSVTSSSNLGIDIQITSNKTELFQLYSMTGGSICLTPTPPPSGGSTTATPQKCSLILDVLWEDYNAWKQSLHAKIFPPHQIIYDNMDQASVETALLTEAFLHSPVIYSSLIVAWQQNLREPGTLTEVEIAQKPLPSEDELIDNFKKRFLSGKSKMGILGGTLLGEAALKDSSSRQFTLKFKGNNGDDLSPIYYLKRPLFSTNDKSLLHPLVAAIDQAFQTELYFNVEMWSQNQKKYDPLPSGQDIDIVVTDITQGTIQAQKVPASNPIYITFPTSDLYGATLDIVIKNGKFKDWISGHLAPQVSPIEEWSIKGWASAGGDHIAQLIASSFPKITLGTSTLPLTFRIGWDYHILFTYQHPTPPGKQFYLPKNIPVQLKKGSASGAQLTQTLTDEGGKIEGVLYTPTPGEKVFFALSLEMQDTGILLNRAIVCQGRVDRDPIAWVNNDDPSLDWTLPTLSKDQPSTAYVLDQEKAVAAYFLKTLRDLSIFLSQLANTKWNGFQSQPLKLFESAISGQAYSWPVGEININPGSFWQRSTIAHEISHQIMWQEAEISSLDIAVQTVSGGYWLTHAPYYITNSYHALIEGWAEFFELLFGDKALYNIFTNSIKTVIKFPPHSLISEIVGLSPSPPINLSATDPDTGEKVEGAFACALYDVFKDVVAPLPSTSLFLFNFVPEMLNQDPVLSWINNSAIQNRFIRLILEPMGQLKTQEKSTTQMLANMKAAATSAEWTAMKSIFNNYNMATNL